MDIKEVLEKHLKWIKDEPGGERADLSGANLSGANLSGANLYKAENVDKALHNLYTLFYPLQCPETGAYIGYKKARGMIVELEITSDALRSSATSRKCRASKAKVLSITDVDGNPAGGAGRKRLRQGFCVHRRRNCRSPEFRCKPLERMCARHPPFYNPRRSGEV